MSSFTVFANREDIIDMYSYDKSIDVDAIQDKAPTLKRGRRKRPHKRYKYRRGGKRNAEKTLENQ